jgi:hypothetical protein
VRRSAAGVGEEAPATRAKLLKSIKFTSNLPRSMPEEAVCSLKYDGNSGNHGVEWIEFQTIQPLRTENNYSKLLNGNNFPSARCLFNAVRLGARSATHSSSAPLSCDLIYRQLAADT